MIAHPNIRNWVVSISTDEDNPAVFGPYTRRKAEELADGFNTRIGGTEVEGQYTFILAGAHPIRNPQSVRALRTEMGL